MMRNLTILGCALLLAFGLSLVSTAGSIVDGDADGVPDAFDNCVTVPNGPLAATGGCNGQEDGNLDGYGNACDTDYNNDGATGLNDVSAALAALGGVDPAIDPNCDGATGLNDVSRTLADLGLAVGPSGLACAGTEPCVAQ